MSETKPEEERCQPVTIAVPRQVLKRLDEWRGEVSRSSIITSFIERCLTEEQQSHG
jgi:metal-responsive CopG/Arc/MetJ family transcriptional regulator